MLKKCPLIICRVPSIIRKYLRGTSPAPRGSRARPRRSGVPAAWGRTCPHIIMWAYCCVLVFFSDRLVLIWVIIIQFNAMICIRYMTCYTTRVYCIWYLRDINIRILRNHNNNHNNDNNDNNIIIAIHYTSCISSRWMASCVRSASPTYSHTYRIIQIK